MFFAASMTQPFAAIPWFLCKNALTSRFQRWTWLPEQNRLEGSSVWLLTVSRQQALSSFCNLFSSVDSWYLVNHALLCSQIEATPIYFTSVGNCTIVPCLQHHKEMWSSLSYWQPKLWWVTLGLLIHYLLFLPNVLKIRYIVPCKAQDNIF